MSVAVLLALVSLCAFHHAAFCASRPLHDADLVLVRGTCTSRLQLARATARNGRNSTELRVVYVLENETLASQLHGRHAGSLNESYLFWPDRADVRKPGDSRVAFAPWLAHRALGDSYKWMLYGDDDTFFFLENVKDLLRDYDPDLPYVISDVLWHKKKRYAMEAPHCLPCHVTPAYRAMAAVRPDANPPHHAPPKPGGRPYVFHQPPVPPAGCPCSTHLACEYTLNVTGKREALSRKRPLRWSPESRAWGLPRGYPSVCDYPHFHGGSGVLISVGAMRKVSYDQALGCFYDDVKNLTAEPKSLKALAHGDRMVSLCFWMHGLATTDPGLSLSKHELSDQLGRVMDGRAANVAGLRQILDAEDPPPAPLLWSVLHMAAAHVGHRNLTESARTAQRLGRLAPVARAAAIGFLQQLGEPVRGELELQISTDIKALEASIKAKSKG